ncbi:MAG: DHHA1 domain-containing protein, partial [Tannerellaceae bacterium]
EKYGDEVRVVKYGSSVELCGGTHASATGNIGSLRIVAESSIAAGVRRIEAVTAEAADNYYYAQQDVLKELRAMMNNMPNLVQAVKKSLDENAELKKQMAEFAKEKAKQLKQDIVASAKDVNGTKLLVFKGNASADVMKDIAFQLKGELGSFFFVAGVETDGKPLLQVMMSDDLVAAGKNASQLVRDGAKHIKGGGGGQAHFATAGGKDASGLSIAVDEIVEKAGL